MHESGSGTRRDAARHHSHIYSTHKLAALRRQKNKLLCSCFHSFLSQGLFSPHMSHVRTHTHTPATLDSHTHTHKQNLSALSVSPCQQHYSLIWGQRQRKWTMCPIIIMEHSQLHIRGQTSSEQWAHGKQIWNHKTVLLGGSCLEGAWCFRCIYHIFTKHHLFCFFQMTQTVVPDMSNSERPINEMTFKSQKQEVDNYSAGFIAVLKRQSLKGSNLLICLRTWVINISDRCFLPLIFVFIRLLSLSNQCKEQKDDGAFILHPFCLCRNRVSNVSSLWALDSVPAAFLSMIMINFCSEWGVQSFIRGSWQIHVEKGVLMWFDHLSGMCPRWGIWAVSIMIDGSCLTVNTWITLHYLDE